MKYRKIPIVVDAVQWSGVNLNDICGFLQDFIKSLEVSDAGRLVINTNRRTVMTFDPQDWAVREGDELYICKPKVFEAKFEKKNP